MAVEEQECVAVNQGEIHPVIFEVYTESGIPFEVKENWSHCSVKTTSGKEVEKIPAKLISDEPASKKYLVSWDTSKYVVGYYLLTVWCMLNITGDLDDKGQLVVEAKIASDELKRYVK